MGSTRARHEREWDSVGEKGPDLGLDALEHQFYPIYADVWFPPEARRFPNLRSLSDSW